MSPAFKRLIEWPMGKGLEPVNGMVAGVIIYTVSYLIMWGLL